jgi:ADP-ribose pyrophosphatase
VTKVVFDGRHVRVELEQVDGRQVEIVRSPDAVAIVAVHAQHVILVRQDRYPTGGKVLELPAGKIDEGETPELAARRELREECGLTGGVWRYHGAYWSTPGTFDERVHLFVATGLEVGDADPDEHEDVEIVRWPLGDVGSRLGEVQDTKTLAGLLLLLREVSFRGS